MREGRREGWGKEGVGQYLATYRNELESNDEMDFVGVGTWSLEKCMCVNVFCCSAYFLVFGSYVV